MDLVVPKNGDYTFEAEDTAGNITEYKVTINNIDKEHPQVEDGGIVVTNIKLDKSKGYIEFNTSKISDNYTPTPDIMFKTDTLDWTPMRSGISDVLSGNTKKIYLRDKVGNVGEFNISVTEGDLGITDEDKTTDDKIIEIDSLSPKVPAPKSGTHYSISFDGVTWSAWEPKTGGSIDVNLPSGEGYKGVYIRAGVQKFKETPVSTKDGIKYIREELEEIEPIDLQERYHYAYDKTAPVLEVKSNNNLWVMNVNNGVGKLPVTFFIEDNIAEEVNLKISILDNTGKALNISGDKSVIVTTINSGTNKDISIELTEDVIRHLKPDKNKSTSCIVKFEATDPTGNTKKVVKSVVLKEK